jgi:AraC-like DNA-binding protein
MRKAFMQGTSYALFDPAYSLPNIWFITHTINEGNLRNGPVFHDSWCEVAYVHSGKGYYTVDHREYTVTAGDLILMNMGKIHAARSDRDDPMERWVCAFNDLHLLGRPANCLIPDNTSPVVYVGEKKGNVINCLCEMLLDACDNPSKSSYLASQHAVSTILSIVDEVAGTTPIDDIAPEDTLANDIITYIDIHYKEALSLEALANEFFISPSYVSHIVKKTYGQSPISYLLDRRIGESIRLLASTSLAISDIAEMVGFPNLNHFSAAFKKKTGVSPGLYRKRLNINTFINKGVIY